jgi:hypothetical protein
MPGIDLAALAEQCRALNEPNQGMRYHGGHSGERRYDERTGKPYWTRSEPATLTVYGPRAVLLKQIIDNCGEIADAILAALPLPDKE